MNEAVRHRIAVVDDEPSVCRALQRLLRLAGFDVDTFTGAEAFLGSLPGRHPDCVVLDLHMPGVTGFDVQAQLAHARRRIPVVAITGHDSPSARDRALAGGAVAYLRKPVSEDDLLVAIHRCLEREGGPGAEPDPGTENQKGVREP